MTEPVVVIAPYPDLAELERRMAGDLNHPREPDRSLSCLPCREGGAFDRGTEFENRWCAILPAILDSGGEPTLKALGYGDGNVNLELKGRLIDTSRTSLSKCMV